MGLVLSKTPSRHQYRQVRILQTIKAGSLFGEMLSIALLVLIVCLFFARVLFSDGTLFGSDFILQFAVWKQFVADRLTSQGSFPLWNPYLFSGSPFIANIQVSMFYPFGFLYYLMPPQTAYLYSTVMHVAMGAVFMFIFVRRLGISLVSSLFAAMIFSLNGYFMGHLYAGHLSFIQAYIWIPLLFCCIHLFVQSGHINWVLLGGLVLGTQILGGFPQLTFYTVLAVGGYALFHLLSCVKGGQLKQGVAVGAGFFIMCVTAAGVAAVQLLPTLEFTGLSTRAGGVSYAFATYDSLHPKELLTLLVPEIFGNVVNGTYWRTGEPWHFWETCGYLGIIPLCLLFARTSSRALGRSRSFFLILVILALFLALGKYNPLYPIVYRLPGFHSFRIPAQILYLFVFGVSVLTGIGLDQISNNRSTIDKRVTFVMGIVGTAVTFLVFAYNMYSRDFFFQLFKIFAVEPVGNLDMEMIAHTTGSSLNQAFALTMTFILLVFAFRYKGINKTAFKILVVMVALIDLGLFGVPFIKSYQNVPDERKDRLASQLSPTPPEGRVTSDHTFGPNGGLAYRFASVLGYNPLILGRYAEYILASEGLSQDHDLVNLSRLKAYEGKLTEMLNLKQIVQNGAITSLDRPAFYATLVDQAVVRQKDQVLSFMRRDEFDPEKLVVLEAPHAWLEAWPDMDTPLIGACRLLAYDNEHIVLETSANRRSYLVLSEIFYPGWQAIVNGKKTPVLRGNYLFRTVPIEKGRHKVELRFVSRPFKIGMLISVITFALALSVMVQKVRKLRSGPANQSCKNERA